LHEAEMLEGGQEADGCALHQPGALGQFGKGEGPVTLLKGRKQQQRPVYRGNTTICR
jgi:hypothetical protein